MVTGSSAAGVLHHEGEGHVATGLRHGGRVRGLGDLDRRQHVGEVDRGIVVVGGSVLSLSIGHAP